MPILHLMAQIHGGHAEPGSTLQRERVAPPLPVEELPAQLARDVRVLALELGERNLRDAPRFFHLERAATFVEQQLALSGLPVTRQAFRAGALGVRNLQVELRGAHHPDEVLVVGARYDSRPGSVGVNDNATGAAVLLALARRCASLRPARTLRFVAFPTGPHTCLPGARVLAQRLRGAQVRGVLSLEALGSSGASSEEPLMVVSNLASRRLARTVTWALQQGEAPLRSRAAFVPGVLPALRRSEPGAFWEQGLPAVRVTQTFPLSAWREDAGVEQLDYERLAQVVRGLERVVERLVLGEH